MRTLLICHENDELDREIIAPWLASFSDLAGVLVLREKPGRMKTRIKREVGRVGYLRFLDVLSFRLYYRLFLAARDAAWRSKTIERFRSEYPELGLTPQLVTHSPNSTEAASFLQDAAPDIVVARCKTLLKKEIFSLAAVATVVFHPGVCPEYRNAHGCFWALAEEDYEKVGMTLLKIDEGVDTGPTYGYYSYDFDELAESHIVIQSRVVLENLPELREKLEAIYAGTAVAIDEGGRESRVWGQPWLTKFWQIRKRAGTRRRTDPNESVKANATAQLDQ